MFDLKGLTLNAITSFFGNLFDELIAYFSSVLVNVMSVAEDVLDLPLVDNGVKYAQILALSILIAKSMYEAFNTYILHQNGDPDADPVGLLIRTGQAVAIIAT